MSEVVFVLANIYLCLCTSYAYFEGLQNFRTYFSNKTPSSWLVNKGGETATQKPKSTFLLKNAFWSSRNRLISPEWMRECLSGFKGSLIVSISCIYFRRFYQKFCRDSNPDLSALYAAKCPDLGQLLFAFMLLTGGLLHLSLRWVELLVKRVSLKNEGEITKRSKRRERRC